MKFIIYSDGGARGNPGHAAFGFIIKSEGNSKFETLNSKQIPNLNIKIQNDIVYGSGYLGKTTNNQAEYNGILAALKFLKLQATSYPGLAERSGAGKLQTIEIECFLDSQLIVEQMNGKYKIKNEGLQPLYWEIRQLIMDLGGNVTFKHIPREQNVEADKLVNEAIGKALHLNSK